MRSPIALPIPGSFSSSSGEAVLILIGASVLGNSTFNRTVDCAGLGSLAQAEPNSDDAITRIAPSKGFDFAAGRFCFTYASDCL